MVNDFRSTVNDFCSTLNNFRSTLDDYRSTVNDSRSTLDDFRSTVNNFRSTVNNYGSTLNDFCSTSTDCPINFGIWRSTPGRDLTAKGSDHRSREHRLPAPQIINASRSSGCWDSWRIGPRCPGRLRGRKLAAHSSPALALRRARGWIVERAFARGTHRARFSSSGRTPRITQSLCGLQFPDAQRGLPSPGPVTTRT